MTKKDLEQLCALPLEIKAIQDNLENLPVIADSVTGSRPCIPFDKHTITIKGINAKRATKLKVKLSLKLDELQDKVEHMEDWLETIEDSEMRTILRLRYRNGLTQAQIAAKLGYSREGVARKLRVFWTRQEKSTTNTI